MCCFRKKKQQKAGAAGANVQSKKDQSSIFQQNNIKEKNSQHEKDSTLKEVAAAPSIPGQDEKQPAAATVKDESKKDKANDELEGPYAAPGPANFVPKLDPAELKEASEVFPVASLKKDVISNDRSAEKMSLDNTLKEVPRRMPETELFHSHDAAAQIFTNDQLL